MRINIEELRKDLINKYGTSMFNGFPMAVMNVSDIERASDEELIRIAEKEHINLSKYTID